MSLWNDLHDPVFDGVELEGFKSRVNAFYLPSCSLPFVPSTAFPFSYFVLWIGIVGLGSSDEKGVNRSLPALPFLIIIIIIIIRDK